MRAGSALPILALVILGPGLALGQQRPARHGAKLAPATILVVRHGQDADNARRVLNGRRQGRLTALGREQALQAARSLHGRRISAIYASPLRRTRQTASIVRTELGLGNVQLEPRLMERDFGVLTGKSVDQIPVLARRTLQVGDVNYFLSAEGAETFPQTYRRARGLLRELSERHAGETIAVVTHGDLGKMLIAAARGWTWQEGLRAANLRNAEIVELKLEGR